MRPIEKLGTMPTQAATTLGGSLIAGTLGALARWVAASVVIGAALAAVVYFLVVRLWPSAAVASGVSIFLAFPTIMLPVAWSNALRCGVARAMRDSGLSRTIADVLIVAAAGTTSASEVRIDLVGLDARIREAVHAAVPIQPGWLRVLVAGTIARRVSREMLGRLRDDLAASGTLEPEVLRQRVAGSIENLTGDWAARRRAA